MAAAARTPARPAERRVARRTDVTEPSAQTPRRVEQRRLSELRLHPQAELVPPMDERAFAEFKADIARRGQLTPIDLTAENVILDGKERRRALADLECERVDVTVVAPVDEVEYILRAALDRRQLTASQRAALAVELANYRELREQAAERQLANLRQNKTEGAELPPRGKSRDQAAAWAGVSPRTLQDAATVHA